MDLFLEVTQNLLVGFAATCKLFILTLIFSLPLGLVVSFCSMSSFFPLRWLVRTFVWIIRGTPLMLQLFIVFYGPGIVWGTTIFSNREVAAVVAFVINYSCYFSEIYRSGIEGVPKGQNEAGHVLGMTKPQIFYHITLLQVIKRIVPPMTNEIMTLVKDTSLARIIAVVDIIFVAQRYITSSALLWPLFYSGVFYLLFCGLLTIIFRQLERKLRFFSV